MNKVHPVFQEILSSIQTDKPTPQDWQAWYVHKSNKEQVMEAEEREAEEE